MAKFNQRAIDNMEPDYEELPTCPECGHEMEESLVVTLMEDEHYLCVNPECEVEYYSFEDISMEE